MSHPGLRRLPDAEEIDAFWRDGVVCLRSVLDIDYVMSMTGAVERLIAESIGTTMYDMTAMGEDLARAGETLATDEARRRLGDAPDLLAEPVVFSVSGLELVAHRLTRRPG